jgi:hypothetical protein
LIIREWHSKHRKKLKIDCYLKKEQSIFMLKLKNIRQLKVDKEFLNFAGERSPNVKITDGAILEIKKTNIKTIKLIIFLGPFTGTDSIDLNFEQADI